MKAPEILHIASHGFFLEDLARGDAQAAAAGNPLLRSGLVLAGANEAQNGSSDGILTALEASSLDLWGTKLVTLSACDTGVGEIRNGEGVYGLRRAFLLAGAETVVMNLWPVSDYVARDVMVTYYAGLHVGLGRGEALRNAKLAMMKTSSPTASVLLGGCDCLWRVGQPRRRALSSSTNHRRFQFPPYSMCLGLLEHFA